MLTGGGDRYDFKIASKQVWVHRKLLLLVGLVKGEGLLRKTSPKKISNFKHLHYVLNLK